MSLEPILRGAAASTLLLLAACGARDTETPEGMTAAGDPGVPAARGSDEPWYAPSKQGSAGQPADAHEADPRHSGLTGLADPSGPTGLTADSTHEATPEETTVATDQEVELEKIVKSDEEWRAQLSPEEYRVARQAGTERAFTGRYWDTKTVGTYKCICCDTPLFRSDTKFDSGCGWPSFFEPLEGANMVELRDTTHGMLRTEVRCSKCDAHLGHVFPDGPPPTGLRYCINSVSLMLNPDEDGEGSDG